MTHPSKTSVTAQFGAGERGEPVAWRWKDASDNWLYSETEPTLLTAGRLNEVQALYAAPVSHTSVKDGGGAQCACMRGGYPIGNCVKCDDPMARDAVADGARETLASELMAFHDCCTQNASGGDGEFRVECSSSSDAQARALRAVLREAAAALRSAPVKAEIKPHRYIPDYEAANGDCAVCGHGSMRTWHVDADNVAPVKAVGSEALRLLAAEDARQEKLHELLETIREQIRLGVEPEHRPEGLFQNIQDAVYAMRGRTLLMNDVAITAALAHPGSGDAETGAGDDIIDLLRDLSSDATREDAVAEILRLRGVLEELAVGFDRARSAATYTAEAQRLNKCAEFCRTAQTTNNGVSP